MIVISLSYLFALVFDFYATFSQSDSSKLVFNVVQYSWVQKKKKKKSRGGAGMGQYGEGCALKALTKKLRPRHVSPAGVRHLSGCVCNEPL